MQIDLARRPPAGPASRVAPVAFALTALVVAVQMTLHLVDYGVYDLRIRALNSNLDRSAVAWISPVALTVALGAAIVIWRRRPVRRGSDLALVVLLAALLLEMLTEVRNSIPHWQLVLALPLGAILVLLLLQAREAHGDAALCIVIGCAGLALSFAIHVVGGPALAHLGWGGDSWPYQVKVAIKEASEITGYMLNAAGLVIVARSLPQRGHAPRVVLGAGG
jgi:hypothetical protein